MATITYRTTEEKRHKLAEMAEEQNISVNKLLDDFVTIALTERESYLRFAVRKIRGNPEKALEILRSKATV